MKDDVISRQDAIAALDVLCQEHRYKIPGELETYSQYNEAWQDALDRAEGAIGNLPSAQPERKNGYRDGYKRGKQAGYKKGREAGRKKGQWIRIPHDGIYCTTCKKGWSFMLGAPGDVENYHYCPHCGARMEEGEESVNR